MALGPRLIPCSLKFSGLEIKQNAFRSSSISRNYLLSPIAISCCAHYIVHQSKKSDFFVTTIAMNTTSHAILWFTVSHGQRSRSGRYQFPSWQRPRSWCSSKPWSLTTRGVLVQPWPPSAHLWWAVMWGLSATRVVAPTVCSRMANWTI